MLVFGAVVAMAWGTWYLWPGSEYYMTCDEVSREFRETLELKKNGKFRYWASSDAELSAPPRYPVTGSYKYNGDRLILECSELPQDKCIRMGNAISGVPVLFRSDGWNVWNKAKRVHPYGVMIRSGRPLVPFTWPVRPSIKQITPQESPQTP